MRYLFVTPVVAVLSLLLAACGPAATDDPKVRPIDDILAGDVRVEPDSSGTVATLRVTTTIPVACAVIYGTDERFGSIATDDDMAGGAHRDHAPLLSGLEPDTEYRYVLQGSDAEGNLYRGQVQTFRTPAVTGDTAAGRNVAPQGRIVDVSSEFSDDFAAANAIDGDLASAWSTAGDGDDASITIDLGRSTDISGVRLRSREMSDGTAIIRTFTVTIDDAEPLGPYDAGTEELARVRATGSQVRIDAVDTTGGNTGAVEIQIYSPT
jgi:hypothetical protein